MNQSESRIFLQVILMAVIHKKDNKNDKILNNSSSFYRMDPGKGFKVGGRPKALRFIIQSYATIALQSRCFTYFGNGLNL